MSDKYSDTLKRASIESLSRMRNQGTLDRKDFFNLVANKVALIKYYKVTVDSLRRCLKAGLITNSDHQGAVEAVKKRIREIYAETTSSLKNLEEFHEIYISVDVEATGPSPATSSMSAIGAFVAGGVHSWNGYPVHFDPHDEDLKFYAELQPMVNTDFEVEAINVGGLRNFKKIETDSPGVEAMRRWEYLKENGESPRAAMTRFVEFVEAVQNKFPNARLVFTAYPASYDWNWVYFYMMNYVGRSPFGFSNVLDLKSYNAGKNQSMLQESSKKNMGKMVQDLPGILGIKHTHFADDDATEQGIMAMALMDL